MTDHPVRDGGISRRQLLAALGAGLATASLGVPTVARAFGEPTKVDIAELDLGPGTISRPDAWMRLLAEVNATTSVATRDVFETGIARLRPTDPELFEHPFMVCVGDGAFDVPDEDGLEQLSRFLAYGGFLLFDDVTGSRSSPFHAAVERLVRVLYPTRSLAPLPKQSHSVYRSFFLNPRPVGRVAEFEDLTGITLGGVRVDGDRREDTTRTPVIVMRNDLSGALERDRAGRYPHPVTPGGALQRKEAVKLGINLVMYALTANYKTDQVHVKELIERNNRDRGVLRFPR